MEENEYEDQWLVDEGPEAEPKPELPERLALRKAQQDVEREFMEGYEATPDEAKADA